MACSTWAKVFRLKAKNVPGTLLNKAFIEKNSLNMIHLEVLPDREET